MIKNIFFDFDGVILDSTDCKTKAFSNLFEEYGKEASEKFTEFHLSCQGKSRYEKIKYFYEHIAKEPYNESKVERKAKQFSEMVLNEVLNADFIKGALPLLQELSPFMSLYLISATPNEELTFILQQKDITPYFKEVFGAPNSKPEVIQRLMNKNRFIKEECLMVGDSLVDYIAAIENGIKFVGVLKSPKSNPFPEDVKVIDDLLIIKEIIK